MTRIGPTMAMLAVLGATSACVDVQGGAVELAWSLRRSDGVSSVQTDCASEHLAEVRLRGESDDGASRFAESWACDRSYGTTLFAIAEGRYSLSIEALCPVTIEPARVVVPDPIVRDVVEGEVVNLNSLLILVVAGAENACDL
ncbi:MAG: hypothetical protein EXR73_03370 [Myxococcales bacterium]|nr:hypothetical protein [Myxococcales bacterium]